MGIYVKGMEMPKNCMECPFSDHEAWCLIPGDPKLRYYCPENEISEHCPLVEVPKPHGRLIDADALVPDICHDWNGWRVPPDDYSEECIRKAPIVIEAEGE